jgi:hypothetical protein
MREYKMLYYPKQTVYAKGRTFLYRAEFPGWEIKQQGDTLGMGEDFFYLARVYRKLKSDESGKWLEVHKEGIHPRMRRILGNKLLRNNNRIVRKKNNRRRIGSKINNYILYILITGSISILLFVMVMHSIRW